MFRKDAGCMKLVDTYNSYKTKYSKYVIMIKCGNFYEVYGEETYIISNLFNYKIKEISGIKRVGFPIIAYNKVTSKLNSFKINYIVIDNEIIKRKFNKNNYDEYLNDLNIDDRINKIYLRLKILSNGSNINNILKSIESII